MAHKEKLRIAAIGDLHVHEQPASCRSLFAQVSEAADVLLLCGDLTHFGEPAEAQNLAADLQQLRIPAVAVLGNHDHESGRVPEVRQVLREHLHFVDEEQFTFADTAFVGVKGFCGGFDARMLSSFGEAAIKTFVQETLQDCLHLERLLQGSAAPHNIVVLHYAPIADTLAGEPLEIFPFLGCSRLAEVIDRFPVAAVFHGHAHHGTPEGRTHKGIPVFNCSDFLMKHHHPDRPFALFELDLDEPAQPRPVAGGGARSARSS